MGQGHLAAQIEQHLAEHADIHATVAEEDEKILLSGTADSAIARKRAAKIVANMAPNRQIVNLLEVEHRLPVGAKGDTALAADDFGQDDLPLGLVDSQTEKEGIQLDPSLTAQPLETNDIDAMDSGSADDLEPVEPDSTYFPPTDPVLRISDQQTLRVVGGFAASSDDAIPVARSAEDNQPGDEALAEAIQRELREDATTTDLNVHAEVDQGVAHLQGIVSDLEDAENAEDVAGRVPGVAEVNDDLDIAQP